MSTILKIKINVQSLNLSGRIKNEKSKLHQLQYIPKVNFNVDSQFQHRKLNPTWHPFKRGQSNPIGQSNPTWQRCYMDEMLDFYRV